jgi:hypothetical protein
VPLEYSIVRVTCTVADIMGAVVVGLLDATLDWIDAQTIDAQTIE